MDNVTFITTENLDGVTTEHAIIAHADGSFTSMPKTVYDAQVKHLTEIIPADEA